MIFFFGLKTEIFKSALTIPRFQLRGKIIDDCELHSANTNKDSWEIKKVICEKNSKFYFVDENEINLKVNKKNYSLKTGCSLLIKFDKIEEFEIVSNCFWLIPLISNYKENFVDVYHG